MNYDRVLSPKGLLGRVLPFLPNPFPPLSIMTCQMSIKYDTRHSRRKAITELFISTVRT